MNKIILLNGCGSSGKTSIARALQHLSEELWLTFGVDTFAEMTLFPLKSDAYYRFAPGENDLGPTMRVEKGHLSDQLFGALPDLAKLLANKGNNLIIDEVLLDEESLKNYVHALQDHTVYFVGVFCDLKTMQEREISRGDRAIGLANDQLQRVHAGIREYDFKVDTTALSPFSVAQQILDFMESTPLPQGFAEMRKM